MLKALWGKIFTGFLERGRLLLFVTAFFAVCLQIQVTVFSYEDYAGLRVSLADFFLRFAGLVSLFLFWKKLSMFPTWANVYVWPALVLLFTVITFSLTNGFLTNGFWSLWAVANKYIGFLVLLAYFGLGSWITTNVKSSEAVFNLFVRAFSYFFIFTLILSSLTFFLQIYSPFSLWLPLYPWDGFMANRNAFMVIAVLVLVFAFLDIKSGCFKLPLWWHYAFWFFLPSFALYNASRTGWIVMGVVFVVGMFWLGFKRVRLVLLLLCLGSLLTFFSTYFVRITDVHNAKQLGLFLALIEFDEEIEYQGDQKRLIAVEDSMALYAHSNPILGAGLGTYQPFQFEKRGKFIDIIDFTALWVLVEMGPVGLAAFFLFFCVCLYTLYQRFHFSGGEFYRSAFCFLLLFAIMSCLHELMYTRFLWFFLGLALAVPSSLQKKDASGFPHASRISV